jgi:hypothetical protein
MPPNGAGQIQDREGDEHQTDHDEEAVHHRTTTPARRSLAATMSIATFR